MAYTRTQLAQLLSERIGDRIAGTATGGAAGGATLTSTDLLSLPGGRYANKYCEITSGTYNGNVRLVNTATVSSGVITLTPYNAFGGAIVNAVTFLIHRFDPVWKYEALNEALRELAAYLPVPVVEDIISGECLRNGNMEYWRDSTNPYDWTIDVGTVSKETTTYYNGAASLKTSATVATEVSQNINLVKELYGVSVTLTAYVYMTTFNGTTRLRLNQPQGTASHSSALAASATWTQLSVSRTITDTMNPLQVSLLHTSTSQAAYWDEVRLLVPAAAKSSINWMPLSDYYTKLRQVQMGYQQGVTTKSVVGGYTQHAMPSRYDRGYAWWNWDKVRFNVPYWFRLLGTARYPNLTAAGDTVEVNQEEARLLVALAGVKLLQKAKGYEHLAGGEYLAEKQRDLAEEVAELKQVVYRDIPALHLPIPVR